MKQKKNRMIKKSEQLCDDRCITATTAHDSILLCWMSAVMTIFSTLYIVVLSQRKYQKFWIGMYKRWFCVFMRNINSIRRHNTISYFHQLSTSFSDKHNCSFIDINLNLCRGKLIGIRHFVVCFDHIVISRIPWPQNTRKTRQKCVHVVE